MDRRFFLGRRFDRVAPSQSAAAADCVLTAIDSDLTIPPDTDTYECGIVIAADVTVSIAADNTLTITEPA